MCGEKEHSDGIARGSLTGECYESCVGSQGDNLVFLVSQPRADLTLLQRILAGSYV